VAVRPVEGHVQGVVNTLDLHRRTVVIGRGRLLGRPPITMFICPMHAEGVIVRPLVDIAGGHHFNEVFLEGVCIADEMVIGEVNDGWRVSSGTLSGQRSGYMGGSGEGVADGN
jgi:alkylation response protein AidB-like acyl-CoA dehydrogenase